MGEGGGEVRRGREGGEAGGLYLQTGSVPTIFCFASKK